MNDSRNKRANVEASIIECIYRLQRRVFDILGEKGEGGAAEAQRVQNEVSAHLNWLFSTKPRTANAWIVLGDFARDPEETLRRYQRALAIEPLNPEANANVANHIAETAPREKVLDMLEKAIEWSPGHPDEEHILFLVELVGERLGLGDIQERAARRRKMLEARDEDQA